MSAIPQQELSRPPSRRISVYVTSKRIHAAELLALRAEWPQLYFTARWPVVRDLSSEQARPASLWLQDNVDDIRRSEVFLSYAAREDELNGSIWETGVAWENGKPIYLVGDNPGYKEWRHAPNTWHFASLEAALTHVRGRLDYANNLEERLTKNFQSAVDRVAALVKP